MRYFPKALFTLSMIGLVACGGSGSSETTPSAGLTVSTKDVTLSGKQFDGEQARQRIDLNYSDDVISLVGMRIIGNAKFDGRNIFNLVSDSSNSSAEIIVYDSDMEGGTYEDQLILQPYPHEDGTLPPITVDLTFIQDATPRLTADFNVTDRSPLKVTEGGPQIRVPASIITGNTIRWSVQPYRFTADDVDAVTSDPIEGVGTEQIELVITPTPALIESIRTNGTEFAPVDFQDKDYPGNYTFLGITIELEED